MRFLADSALHGITATKPESLSAPCLAALVANSWNTSATLFVVCSPSLISGPSKDEEFP